MDYPKSVPNVGLVSGKFVDENTSTGQVGSLIPATWGSAVTDEILNVIMGGGVAPEENQNDQLLLAIKEIIKDNIPPEKIRTTLAEYGITDAYTKTKVYTKEEINELLKNATALPVGAMVPFPLGVVPPGYLEVDNRLFKDDVYPDLAAYLAKKFNLAGDAADYTRLPESRGEFFRGWDHGRGVDAGRVIGSGQLDEIKKHRHPQYEYDTNDSWPIPDGSRAFDLNANYAVGKEVPALIGYTGGSETRPRNLAVMWCIKAWNAPINQGNIDIAALSMLVAQATETSQGTAKIATDAQMLESANNEVIVTPKKLRKGLAVSLGVNGHIVLPWFLGGLIFQWGSTAVTSTSAVFTFPIEFPNALYTVTGTPIGSGASSGAGGGAISAGTRMGATIYVWGTGNWTYRWFAIGS